MNKKKLTLLTAVLIVILALSGVAAFFIVTAENKKPSSDKIRIACVGDSITEGTGYPSDLASLLGANYTVHDFGVGGTTVTLDSESPYMHTNAFQDAQEFQPNIIVIMLGTNDAHIDDEQYNSSFVPNYMQLIAAFQALQSNPKIWIVLPPPVFNNSYGVSPQYFAQTIIPSIKQVANQTNLPVINVYLALTDYFRYFPDGVHPDGAGAQIIANTVYDALKSNST